MTKNTPFEDCTGLPQEYQDMVGNVLERTPLETPVKQPSVTQFTKIGWVNDDMCKAVWLLSVKLDGDWRVIAKFDNFNAAEKAELAINQVMIEYRTRRNSWETALSDGSSALSRS